MLQAPSHSVNNRTVSKQSAGRPSSRFLPLLGHLEVVVFVGVCCEQVFGALDIVGQLRLSQVGPKLLQHLGCGFHCHGKVLYGLRRKNPRVTLQHPKNTCYILGIASADVMCDDSQSGGVSTDCDSTPDFLQAPGSAGLCPRSRAGPTESSASRSAKHTQQIRTSSLEHDVHLTVQPLEFKSEKITLMTSSGISQFPDWYLWIQTALKVLYPVQWDSSQAGR